MSGIRIKSAGKATVPGTTTHPFRAPDGSYLVEGKRVSGFTNMEEKLNRTAKAMPFSPEDEIGKRGGRFTKRPPFSTFAVADGRLISGQNPMSAAKTATLLVEALQA
nr:hypothetical protein [uncultured Olsenella sp.]